MNVGKIVNRSLKLAKCIGMAAWSGLGVCALVNTIRDHREDKRKRNWLDGYDTAKRHYEDEIKGLRKRNQELIEEAYKKSQAAE